MYDLSKLRKEQIRLARKIIKTDDFPQKLTTIAGCDVAYLGNTMMCAIVVMDIDTLKIREKIYRIEKVCFPYLSGFLGYREAPIMIETYHELELDPDIFIIDGNGVLHPHFFGLASQVGLSLDKPSIGVAKALLCGKEKDDKIILDEKIIGKSLKTRDISKPIYVSIGNKVSLKTATNIVNKTVIGHKMPEPLHQAHKYANKIKRKFKAKEL
jgi:deoxyribonuclease V